MKDGLSFMAGAYLLPMGIYLYAALPSFEVIQFGGQKTRVNEMRYISKLTELDDQIKARITRIEQLLRTVGFPCAVIFPTSEPAIKMDGKGGELKCNAFRVVGWHDRKTTLNEEQLKYVQTIGYVVDSVMYKHETVNGTLLLRQFSQAEAEEFFVEAKKSKPYRELKRPEPVTIQSVISTNRALPNLLTVEALLSNGKKETIPVGIDTNVGDVVDDWFIGKCPLNFSQYEPTPKPAAAPKM